MGREETRLVNRQVAATRGQHQQRQEVAVRGLRANRNLATNGLDDTSGIEI